MAIRKIGILNEDLIHPGESLKEILDDRNMMQKELAMRTGVTEKHISSIVNGTSQITVDFAKKLEYALGINASFWINLQTNFNQEVFEFEELTRITDLELIIYKELKEVRDYLVRNGILKNNNNQQSIIELRKFLGLSNLESVRELSYSATYRMQNSSTVNTNVLYAWQRICELEVNEINISTRLNVEKLELSINRIKDTMFEDITNIQLKLIDIFSECGVKFRIVRHFKGAPVQGFIRKNKDESITLCMTIRRGMADIFWFTLMHEIAHILNNDIKDTFVDYNDSESQVEKRADKCAANFLLDPIQYSKFINKQDFTIRTITSFANEQKVKPYIVIGRLKKENFILYNRFAEFIDIYQWIE